MDAQNICVEADGKVSNKFNMIFFGEHSMPVT